jgi:hypothetical protein
VMAEYA